MQQVVVERCLIDRSRYSALRQFSRDALLLKQILGRFRQIGAIGPEHGSADYSRLSVHMNSETGVVARWSSIPADGAKEARISLVGTNGQLSIDISDNATRWDVGQSIDPILDEQPAIWDEASAVVESIVRQVRAKDVPSTWESACRATDLSELIDSSLRRNKTLELYHEAHSEELTFKGMMAVGGCGLLLLTLGLIFAAAIVNTLEIPFLEHPIWQETPWKYLYWRRWPFYLLGLLAFFLLLQLFKLVFAGSSPGLRETGDTSS